nr:hypothetical protein GEV33_015347 [Tenebrio molitor]
MGGRETRDKTKTHWTKTKTHYSPPGSQRPFLHKSAEEVLLLTAGYRRQRLEWFRERQQWREEWHNRVFSDESRFCLGMHDGRRGVRRRHGVEFDVEKSIHRTVGVMTLAQLQHEIQVAWDQVPQEDIDHLISSMPRRLNEYSGKAPSVLTVGVCRPPPEIFRELVLKDTSVAASAVRETEKGGLVIHPPPTPHRLFHRLIPVNFVVDCRLWFRIRSALDQTQ